MINEPIYGVQEPQELSDAVTALLIISNCERQFNMNFWMVRCRTTGLTSGVSNRNDFEEWRREVIKISGPDGRAGAAMITPRFQLNGTAV